MAGAPTFARAVAPSISRAGTGFVFIAPGARTHARMFAASAAGLARRKAAPTFDSKADDAIEPLSGDWNTDGMHRYELDLLETTEWTMSLLADMQAPLPEEFVPPRKVFAQGIVIQKASEFHYELDKHAHNGDEGKCPMKLHVQVSRLATAFKSEEANRRFRVLADPFCEGIGESCVFTLKSNPLEEAGAELSVAQRELSLLKKLKAFIDEANSTENAALANTNIRPRKVRRNLQFPEAWKRPVDISKPTAGETTV
ncbi:hypothetical protein HDU82_007972 [Entophlyctis luteolus]|nr:hypothetical protein HDU82_007972 [Entophlyctis luteolus]